jgi:hypothetical protein
MLLAIEHSAVLLYSGIVCLVKSECFLHEHESYILAYLHPTDLL